jgi:hypothetical protein
MLSDANGLFPTNFMLVQQQFDCPVCYLERQPMVWTFHATACAVITLTKSSLRPLMRL